ncbi:MAG: two-component regulator propeller domain-containing protein, partial [Bacteroidota bacterium]
MFNAIYCPTCSFIWIACFLLLPICGTGQSITREKTPVFNRLMMEDGLPSDEVNCVVSDQQGFIWIGTTNGLCKFDGRNFKLYQHDPQNTNSIPSNTIRTLHADSFGNIWIGTTGGGLARINTQTEKLTTFTHNPSDEGSLSHDEILCIYSDRSKRLWVGTE